MQTIKQSLKDTRKRGRPLFVTKDEIRQTVRQIINDDVNNDIVFIIANKGFGKYKLLKEINGFHYQKDIIITNGEHFHSDSVLKNCLMQGIYEFLRRNNSLFQRNRLGKLISKKGKNISISNRIWFQFHVKMTADEIECLLTGFSLRLLVDIYKEFSSNAPLVFFIRGTELSDSDEVFLSRLNTEINTTRFTYIIALRPNPMGIKLIKNVTENRNERVWICPLMPAIRDTISSSKIVKIPSISLSDVKDKDSYNEFKSEIVQKDYYNPVFEVVDNLLDSGINPSMIFTVATQEISHTDFEYVNSLTVRLLHEPKASPYNDALLAHNGKFMWVDALAYYLFVNEGIEEIILELQKFYFAFITDISKWKSNSNSLSSLQVVMPNKESRNRINKFLKEMSELSGNPIIPEITKYISKFSAWVRVFSRPATSDRINPNATDSLVNELDTFNIGFADVNIHALQVINHETACLGALDIGLLVIARKLVIDSELTSKEVTAINSFVRNCLNEVLRWNDMTLAEEVCDVLILLKENGILREYYVPEISNNHSMYRYLAQCMENKNLEIGEIIMGRKTIFISYTDADAEVVDTIDTYLTSCGYDVKRDIRDIGNYDSIVEFMKKIRTQDFVVPVVSDTYLRRNNCMYEVAQLLKDDNFARRTFPVIIDPPKTSDRTYSFFDIRYQIEIINFWESEAKALNADIEKLSLENKAELSEEYRRIKNYAQTVSEFMKWFKSELVGVVPAGIDSTQKQLKAQDIAATIDSKLSEITE